MSCVQSQNISITLKVQRGNEIVPLSSTQDVKERWKDSAPPFHLVTGRTQGHSLLNAKELRRMGRGGEGREERGGEGSRGREGNEEGRGGDGWGGIQRRGRRGKGEEKEGKGRGGEGKG